jgi:hypothetical protein
LVAFSNENCVFILLMDVLDFTLRVLLSLWVMLWTNTILPKIWSTFHVFRACYFRNLGLLMRGRGVSVRGAYGRIIVAVLCGFGECVSGIS